MPERVTRTVPPDGPPTRLDVFLARCIPGLTRSRAQRLLRDGRIHVDGETTRRASFRPAPGAVVTVDLPPADEPGLIARPMPLQVPYEDEHLLIVDKPAGLPVHPGPGHADDTLVNALLARNPDIAGVGDPDRPGIVHRLDMDTSGLMLVALTLAAFDALSEAVRARTVRRGYTALVAGAVQPPEGIIDAPIGRHPRERMRQAVVETGRPARTRYEVQRRLEGATLLAVWLETGRMHQIRVHMASIGHPVLGDTVYGGRRPRQVSGLNRQFLHAASLELDHPITGKPLNASSPLPSDLQGTLDTLRPA